MNHTVFSRTRPLVVPLLALSLLLTACSGGADEPTPDLPSGEPNASEAPVVVGPKECVLGSWKVDNPTFAKFINSSTAGADVPAGVDMTMNVSGNSYLRFDGNGSYFSWRDDFTLTMGSGEHTVTHVSNSGETGDYGVVLGFGSTVKNDFLWVAETMVVMRDEVMTVGGLTQVVDTGGQTVTVDIFQGYKGELPVIDDRESVEGTGPFRCDGDVLKFELETGMEMLYHRSTVTYK